MENQALKNCCCSVCGGSLDYLFFAQDYISGEVFQIGQCQECALAATRPDLKVGDFERYYPKFYYGRRKSFTDHWINNSRLRRINKIFVGLKNRGVKSSLLDVGCGDGGLIYLLATRGWQVTGTEVAPPGSHANASPDCICRRELINCNFNDASFDVVTMWHSLEHFSEPLVYLREVRRILKKEGVLLLEAPNFGSWQAKFFKGNWFHLDVPRHVFHYDIKSLQSILRKTNFTICKISYFSFIYGFFGLLQSSLNVLCRRKNLLFDIINRKISKRDLLHNCRDTIFTFLFFIPVSSLSLPFFLLESVFKKGSILTVWAKKM